MCRLWSPVFIHVMWWHETNWIRFNREAIGVCRHGYQYESICFRNVKQAVWSHRPNIAASLTVVLWLYNWVFLLPPADVRLEEFVYEKLEKKAPTRMNNHELLGQTMIESGGEFGPGTAYGEWCLTSWDLNECFTPAEVWWTLAVARISLICC